MTRKEKLRMAGIIAGNVVICVAAVTVVPKVVTNMSGYMLKKSIKSSMKDDDDWGPEIVDIDETKEEV